MSIFKSGDSNVSIINNSATGGELAPGLWGRTDLARYDVSMALLRNWIIDYKGGFMTRPGTRFCAFAAADSVELFPFQYSSEISYMLEFSPNLIRVIKEGSYVLTGSVGVFGITQANPGVVTTSAHSFQNGDVVYFSGVGGMTRLNGQFYTVANRTGTTFELQDMFGAAVNTTSYSAYTSGGTVAKIYSITSPYTADQLPSLKYSQSKNTMTLTHQEVLPYELVCGGDNNWALNPVAIGSGIAEPTNCVADATFATVSGVLNYEHAYCVTAVNANGEESQASEVSRVTAPNFTGGTYTNIEVTWDVNPAAVFYNIYKAIPARNAVGIPVGAQYGYCGMSYGNKFNDTNITADFTKTPPLNQNPFANNRIESVQVDAGGTGYTRTSIATITDATGTGAQVAPVVNGSTIVGMVVLRKGENYTSPTITVADGTGATFTVALGTPTGNYPGSSVYFQQRRVLASTVNAPETIWATQPGMFSNMDTRNPTLADDSYQFALAGLRLNTIRSMVPMPGGLVLGTDSGAWQLTGNGSNTAVTAIEANGVPQGYNGFSDLPPLIVNQDILFMQVNQRTLRNLTYNYYNNIYTGQDLTVFSTHLFLDYTIADMTYAEDPFKCVWCVRSDGRLLSMTFLRDQEVFGWSHHTTQGKFVAVGSIQEGAGNATYVAVSRYLNGQWKTCVERFDDRSFEKIEDAWCVDCGLQYPLTYPAATASASAATGVITLSAGASVFGVGDVGKVLRFGGGQGVVTAYGSPTQLSVTLSEPITAVIDDDPSNTPLPQVAGAWSLTAPVTVISGLEHLEGKSVVGTADGEAVGPFTVTNGAVTLSTPASRVTIGLGFTCAAQTLPMNSKQAQVQTKWKKISAVTMRLVNTRQLQWGPDFQSLNEFNGTLVPGFVEAEGVGQVADEWQLTENVWNTLGQIAIRQEYPLPATVAGIIYEVDVGSN